MRPESPQTVRPSKATSLSVVIVFSALIAVGTFLSVKLPTPLGEITWSPPIYLALSVLAGPIVGAEATALGSFIGESFNVALLGWPAIYAPGIVWARAPEAFIVGWARKKGTRMLVAAMVLATAFETLAFFVPDGLFYAYGLFGYGSPAGLESGFVVASSDLLTMLDAAFIPVALLLIKVARPPFRRLGFD